MKALNKGFTLIEMLVVIGIIAILLGASVTGYSKMVKSAEKAKIQELVNNVAVALTHYYQTEGSWPKAILSEAAGGDGRVNEKVGLILAKKGLLSLTTDSLNSPQYATKLAGFDRFGVVTPLAQVAIKKYGTTASESTLVTGTSTIRDHVLHFAIDFDGDGIIDGARVGGESVNIRAVAAVWAIGKTGGNSGQPWAYKIGRKKDDVYSWSYGQTQAVK